MKRWVWLAVLAGVALVGGGLLRALTGSPVPPVRSSGQRQVLTAGAPPLSSASAGANAAPGDRRQTVLILGVDERADDAGRSDTMMITALDATGKELPLVSLPRDTWASIPGYGWDKISHAYAYGREPLAKDTVRDFLDLPVDHFVVVNFQGFKAIVDAVGGVDINIEQPMDYDDPYDGDTGLHIHFQPGMQRLDGQKALEYARFRGDENGDLGRIRRQQTLIKAVMERALRPEIVLRLPALARALAETVRTDLSITQLVKLAVQARALSGTPAITSVVLAPASDRYFQGVFYSILDRVAVRTAAYRALMGGDPPADFLARARDAESSLRVALAREEAAARIVIAAAPPAPAAGGAGGSTGTRGAQVVVKPIPQPAPAIPGRGAIVLPPNPVRPGGQTGSTRGGASDPASGAVGNAPGGAASGSGTTGGATGGATGSGQVTLPGQLPVVKPGDAPGVQRPAVALVNLSGKQLSARWYSLLRTAGFRVVTVGRGHRTIPTTVIVDRSGGDEEMLGILKRLFPWAQVESAPANGEFAAEVHLGKDAGNDRSPW